VASTPPGAGRPPGLESHEYRQVAESFGADAEQYDRARPSYPGALVDRIVGGRAGLDVLDVGCGTGIAAGCCPTPLSFRPGCPAPTCTW